VTRLEYKSPGSGEAAAIARVFRESIPPRVAPLTIYGCPGVERFLADQLASDSPHKDTTYLVARGEGNVLGACELRRAPARVHLNYIAVVPGMQGQGAGARLLAAAFEALPATDPETLLTLEVFADNDRARRWYERLGLRETGKAGWWTAPLPAGRPTGRAIVRGLPQATLLHARYGFSEVTVQTSRGSYAVGRLGEKFYRTLSSELLGDAAALACLGEMDFQRRTLLIVCGQTAPCERAEAVATSLQMAAPLQDVRAALFNRTKEALDASPTGT
jgi:GNAT superfamily N-acetyltransferase